jgi:predicted Fe-Mo cluster-binding NifX family protein
MRILIPSEDARGLNARIHGHTGSAPYFTIVDAATGEVEVIRNATAVRDHHHGSGQCGLLARGDLPHFDLVICRGMGRRALSTLREAGLEVLATDRGRVIEALEEYRSGLRNSFTSTAACDR